MSWTPEQIEAAKELAEVLKEKRIEWEWRWQDPYLYEDDYGRQFKLYLNEPYLEPCCVPLPTFERCLELLKEWGYDFWGVSIRYADISGKYEITIHKAGGHWLRVPGPDPTTCAILACKEAVKRNG